MKKQVNVSIPTRWGTFDIYAYADNSTERMPHLAVVHPEMDPDTETLVRVHSECLTGDLLGSKRCDCGSQLHQSMNMVQKENGVLLYLRQEGRGIGLTNKLKAYRLQNEGLNTVDANHQLGFEADERTYDIAIFMLKDLGLSRIRLLTNNPGKIKGIQKDGIEIVERIPIQIAPDEINEEYLQTKKDVMGHFLD